MCPKPSQPVERELLETEDAVACGRAVDPPHVLAFGCQQPTITRSGIEAQDPVGPRTMGIFSVEYLPHNSSEFSGQAAAEQR